MTYKGIAEWLAITLTEALAIIAEGGELPEGYELAEASHDFGALAFADAAAELEAAAAVVAGAANAEDLTFDPTYSLSDESLTAADVADVAVADLAAAQEAAVEELRTSELVAGATNGAEIVINNGAYTLADTLENLAADAAVLEGAASYSLTDEAGDLGSLTEEQIALVQGATNAADFTYFTLTKGLEDLAAANTALDDFLEGIDRDEDGNADYATVAALDSAVDAAESDVATDATVGVGTSYIDGSAAVKAQLIAAKQTELDNDLALDQIVLDEAQAKVDAVAGLSAAIASLEAATTAVTDATAAQTAANKAESVAQAAAEAALVADTAVSTAGTLTGVVSVNTAASGTGDLQASVTYKLTKVDSESNLVSLLDPAKEIVTGSAVLTDADEIAAVKALQEELADYIVAYNASVAADNALTAANDDKTYAQAVVDHLDISEAAATELAKVGAGFTLTTPANEDLPTYDEVQDEITALITDAASKYATFAGADADLNDSTNGAIATFNGATTDPTVATVVNTTSLLITDITLDDDGTDTKFSAVSIIDTDTDGVFSLKSTVTDTNGALQNIVDLANSYNSTLTAAVDALQASYDFADTATAAAGDQSGEDLYDAITALTGSNTPVDASVTGLYDAFDTQNTTDGNDLTDALDAANLAILNDKGTEDTSDDTGSQANLDAFAALLAEEAELLELQAQADELEAAIQAAIDAFGENGFGTPVELDTAKTYYATSGDDLFVVDAEVGSTVRSFDAQGSDMLYIGSAHTVNMSKLAGTTDEDAGEFTLKDAGDQAVLEVFFEETSTGLNLYFENETYASEVASGKIPGADMTTVTLVGVTLEEISITDGILTLV